MSSNLKRTKLTINYKDKVKFLEINFVKITKNTSALIT